MYKKAQPWTGRNDGSEDGHLRWHQAIDIEDLDDTIIHSHDFGLLGFMCDEGVKRNNGRIGAKRGPEFLRKACSNFPKITKVQLADYGDVICENTELVSSQIELGDSVFKLQKEGIKTVIFGGGHEVMYGHFNGLRKAYPKSKIGIINFDAHFDNRKIDEKIGPTSGTGFWQIAQEDSNYKYLAIGIQQNSNTKILFDEAHNTKTEFILAKDINPENEVLINQKIKSWSSDIDILYVTICLDVFAAPYAPGVSATAYNGIIPDYFFKKIFTTAIASSKLKAFDIAELNPDFDQDNRTAKLAASLVFDLCSIMIGES